VNEVLALQSEFAKPKVAAMQTQAMELDAVAKDTIAPATRKLISRFSRILSGAKNAMR
jgi:hypothetical protein